MKLVKHCFVLSEKFFWKIFQQQVLVMDIHANISKYDIHIALHILTYFFVAWPVLFCIYYY